MDLAVKSLTSSQISGLDSIENTANNVANSNVTSFQKQGMIFSEYIDKNGNSYPNNSINFNVYDQGGLEKTGSQLDVAITKPYIYFSVQDKNGKSYTRNGSFSVNNESILVNSEGLPVLSEDFSPISIPNDGNITITGDGNIIVNNSIVGKIGTFKFNNKNLLKRKGNGLFSSTEEPISLKESFVAQGFIESSNVNTVSETANMININRSFSINTSLQNELLKIRVDLINKISE